MQPIDMKHVLAAVDFSDWTPPVLKAATEVAGRYEAKLTAIYTEMVFPPAYYGEEALVNIRKIMDEEQNRAEQHLLGAVQKEVGDKVPFETTVLQAMPAEGILRTASEVEADLIVLGTHGRSGVSRLLMGSVAKKVVRQAKVPVLTVHGMEKDVSAFQKVLCPVNFTNAALDSLQYAANFAHRFGAELVVMNSLEEEPEALSEAVREYEQKLCEWIPEAVRAICHPRPVIRYGQAAAQVLREAEEGEYDLIVIGAQHKPLLETTIFGATSVQVMRHAKCPVLTVFRHKNGI